MSSSVDPPPPGSLPKSPAIPGPLWPHQSHGVRAGGHGGGGGSGQWDPDPLTRPSSAQGRSHRPSSRSAFAPTSPQPWARSHPGASKDPPQTRQPLWALAPHLHKQWVQTPELLLGAPRPARCHSERRQRHSHTGCWVRSTPGTEASPTPRRLLPGGSILNCSAPPHTPLRLRFLALLRPGKASGSHAPAGDPTQLFPSWRVAPGPFVPPRDPTTPAAPSVASPSPSSGRPGSAG